MPHLETLTINNFKGVYESQSISFAAPKGVRGSGLTVLVGSNNSGKSTVFDAMLKLNEHGKIFRDERSDRETRISFSKDNGEETVVSNISGGSQLSITGESPYSVNDFEFISSRRHWNHRFNGETSYRDYHQQRFREGRVIGSDGGLGGLLARVNKDKATRAKFNEFIITVLPNFNSWTLDSDDTGDFIEYKTKGGASHKANLFGDGLISLFRIGAHIVNTNDEKVLIIDEPELSLHPQAQRKLAAQLSLLSSNKQIVLATHSPHFVNWNDLENGSKIVKVRKKQDRKTEFFQLKNEASYYKKMLTFASDWTKPQLLDSVAKELFFSEGITFVEGQEDVGLIAAFLKNENISLNFDIHGYGSGGANNIPFFLEMAEDLGIQAGAIFDGDKSKEAEECTKRFPLFKIRSLSTPDIRDKYDDTSSSKSTPSKIGIFDKSGGIKPQYKSEFEGIIREFNQYFEMNEPKEQGVQ
jgi:predicted ATP-dependent endonuclease of OLD family